MRSFKEHIEDNPDETLDENALRGLSSIVIYGRIVKKKNQIRAASKIADKMNLLAEQNVSVAALIAATQFLPNNSNKKRN